MKFENNQRVEVVRQDHPLLGATGTVVRLLRRSRDEAWVNIDGKPLPIDLQSFPANDEHGRGNHMLLHVSECRTTDAD